MRMTLRISDEIHEKLKVKAGASKRSLNAEIEYRLDASLDHQFRGALERGTEGGEKHGTSDAVRTEVQAVAGDASAKTRLVGQGKKAAAVPEVAADDLELEVVKPVREPHDPKTCRVYRCGQCIAAGKKF